MSDPGCDKIELCPHLNSCGSFPVGFSLSHTH